MRRARILPGRVAVSGRVVATTLALAGCVGTVPEAPQLAAPPPVPTDPVVAFAANAAIGEEASLTLAGGSPARARLQRAYTSGTGRECREVVLNRVTQEWSQLVCRDPELGWVPVRNLLRGGAP